MCKIIRFFSLLLVILVTVFSSVPCLAADASDDGRDDIRIGVFESDRYCYYDRSGNLRGYSVDISKAMAIYGMYNAVLVPYTTISQMEEDLRSGRVDALVDFIHTDARDNEFIFTSRPVNEEYIILYTKDDSDLNADDISEINGRKIGYIDKSGYIDSFSDFCQENGISVSTVVYQDGEMLNEALNKGEIDAALTGSSISNGQKNFYKINMEQSFYMLRSDNTVLRDRIDNAFEQLVASNRNYLSDIYNKYIEPTDNELKPFSVQELKYLDSHPVITVALVKNDTPFSSVGEEIAEGIIPAYYRKLGEKLGVSFIFALYDTNQQAIEAVNRGINDIVGHYYGDIIIAEPHGLIDTHPYVSESCAIVKKESFTGTPVKAAVTVKTLSILKERFGDKYVMTAYKNIEDCIKAVNAGAADCYIDSMTAATWVLNKYTTSNINLMVIPNSSISLRGAVKSDNLVLLNILNSAINISRSEMVQISAENTAVDIHDFKSLFERIPTSIAVGVFIALSVLVISLIAALIMLYRFNKERMAVLNKKVDEDNLTHAGSREYGNELLHQEFEYFQKTGVSSLYAMFDVDHFKDKNDRFGHEYGDYVLVKLVQALKDSMRNTDTIIRWGGDEFIIICPQAIPEFAPKILNKIVNTVRNTEFTFNGHTVDITVSVGGGFFEEGDRAIEHMLRRIDKALYKAKETRNTWHLAGAEDTPPENE